jgi:hypothetical protein
MTLDSLESDPDVFLESLDQGLNESQLLNLITNHRPYLHFGECTLCDGLLDYFEAGELDFGLVAALIATHPSATSAVQEAALNSALQQSEGDATAEVAFALAQNPSCSAESLQSCVEVEGSMEMYRLVFQHLNVSDETKAWILDEVDNDESKLS